MDDLIKTIETFLSYSEEKLEELHVANQALREELPSEALEETR